MSRQQGQAAESAARVYLEGQGLIWRESNYQTKMGEIDLIMQDKQAIIFVEVRARRSEDFGGAIESITRAKQRKIIKTAAAYLQHHRLSDYYSSRFDVLILQGLPAQINWIPNAFGADGLGWMI